MIDEQDQGTTLIGGQLQARRHRLGEDRASFRMRPGANSLSGIVQQEREIEHVWVVNFFEQPAVSLQLRIFGRAERIELLDADEGVLVCGLTLQILEVHEAGQVT
jgi:hypothetical protein